MNFDLEGRYQMPFSNNGMQDASLFGKPSRTEEGNLPGQVGKAQGANAAGEEKKAGGKSDPANCETCKNRKYQDGSDESDVSFQTATHIDPSSAGARVRAHEQEHVSNAYSKAAEAGGKVISVGVAIHTAVCPECGRTYVSGGVTHSVIAYPQENGSSKIESTNGDPEEKPDAHGIAKDAGERGKKQDFTVGMPAAKGAESSAAAGAGGGSAQRAQGVMQRPRTVQGANAGSSVGRTAGAMNPYAAAQRAAEARRSAGAIFRAKV